MLTKTLHEN